MQPLMSLLRQFVLLAAGAALLSSAAACSSSSNTSNSSGPPAASSRVFPVTLTASNGAVTIKHKPQRIVSLDPTATEDLYKVGAGGQVVAVDADSNYPAGAPVTKLSGLTPNIEAIAKYNPDLVINYRDTGGMSAALGKLGIPVLIEPAASTLPQAYAQIEQLGQATGHLAQARTVTASMRTEIAATVHAAGVHKDLTYYWELGANPYYSAASSTFLGHVVALFGLKNIADAADKASDGGYPQLTPEYIVSAKPDIIFLGDNQASDGGQAPAIVAGRPGWSGIPAVAHHEIIGLNDDVASRWGPRLPQLVASIAQAVEHAG